MTIRPRIAAQKPIKAFFIKLLGLSLLLSPALAGPVDAGEQAQATPPNLEFVGKFMIYVADQPREPNVLRLHPVAGKQDFWAAGFDNYRLGGASGAAQSNLANSPFAQFVARKIAETPMF